MAIRLSRVRPVRRAYTLVEILIVVTVIGIAASMIIPSISSASVLRIQGAIRTIVADIAVAQSDAIAYQKGRAIIFSTDPLTPSYGVYEVNGATIDPTVDKLSEQNLAGAQFGGITFENSTLPGGMLIFDELGGPVTAPQGSTPAAAGFFELVGSGQRFRLNIEAYTGKVTIDTMPP